MQGRHYLLNRWQDLIHRAFWSFRQRRIRSFEGGNEPSNVLTHVSAAELKTDEMIKLPIYLKAKPQWVEAVQEALDKRAELEKLAE